MKRSTRVVVSFEGAQHQHDEAVNRVAEALRHLPYAGSAPWRAVTIK